LCQALGKNENEENGKIFRNYSTKAQNQINEDLKVRTKNSYSSSNISFDHLPSRNFDDQLKESLH